MDNSFNPADHSGGPFSPLTSLLRDALRETGETSPDVLLSNDQKRYVNYANRVVDDVNRHPYFADMLRHRWPRTTGAITAGSNILTVASELSLPDTSPLVIEGAGAGGGDFYTMLYTSPNVASQTRQLQLADAAHSTVTNAPVRSPYETRLRRYVSVADIRAVDDPVMIDGLKYYSAIDDAASQTLAPANLNLRIVYFQTLNQWLATLAGLYGELNIQPVERDVSGW